jgi:hypothetical protein
MQDWPDWHYSCEQELYSIPVVQSMPVYTWQLLKLLSSNEPGAAGLCEAWISSILPDWK